jgi:type I site-specific restriction endonuclease
MNLLDIPTVDCANESDVEQKFLYPLLTHPSFLEIPAKAILTKKSLGTLSFVTKSALPKNYIPDYLIFFSGFPTCVVEAKAPEIPVEQALQEARLYSQVLNSNFPSGTNPISIVVGCNGRELAVGP